MKHLSRLLLAILICLPFSGHAQTLGLSPAGTATQAPVVYSANAVDYDGTSDYLTRASGLSGAVDDNQGIISFWARADGGDGSNLGFFATDQNHHRILRLSGNSFLIRVANESGTLLLSDTVSASITQSANWHHYLIAWDTDTPTCQIYINDVDESVATCATGNVDNGEADWWLATDNTGSSKWNGCIADFYFNSTETLDLDTESNRRLFNDGTGGNAGGKPVNLSTDGSTPTSGQPIMYMSGVAASAGTNAGSGGDFTIVGSPAVCSTSPSD